MCRRVPFDSLGGACDGLFLLRRHHVRKVCTQVGEVIGCFSRHRLERHHALNDTPEPERPRRVRRFEICVATGQFHRIHHKRHSDVHLPLQRLCHRYPHIDRRGLQYRALLPDRPLVTRVGLLNIDAREVYAVLPLVDKCEDIWQHRRVWGSCVACREKNGRTRGLHRRTRVEELHCIPVHAMDSRVGRYLTHLEMAITHPVVSTIVRYLNHFRVTIQEHLCAPHRLGRDQWGDTTFDANPMLQIIDDLGDVGPTILPEQGLVVWAQTENLFLPQHVLENLCGYIPARPHISCVSSCVLCLVSHIPSK
eukprot:m.84121 g.84121  ORF g.84121 m.84121 type:complete len:308 (+) comp19689_c0_seq1:224-1147(+)